MTYREIYGELGNKILEDYGPKCEDFYPDCIVCRAYECMEFILESMGYEEE